MQHIYSEKWHLTLRERRGLLMLSAALLLSVLTPLLWKESTEYARGAPSDAAWTSPGHPISAPEKTREPYKDRSLKYDRNRSTLRLKEASASGVRVPFDPNTIGAADAARLGIPDRLFRTMDRYRQRGGRFRKPEDLQKVYGISTPLFESLRPFIAIPSLVRKKDSTSIDRSDRFRPTREYASIGINSATETEWESLPGIGATLAGRIVRFREALGGFIDTRQVSEVFGVSDSTYWLILPLLKMDYAPLRRIDVNHSDSDELEAHPYISRRQAQFLVSYRRQHGRISSPEALLDTRVLSKEWMDKVMPYLDFQH